MIRIIVNSVLMASVLFSSPGDAHPTQSLNASQNVAQISSLGRNWPIKKGYVAFGDSYAAGMGTGSTTGDKCRIGENNIGDLIAQWEPLAAGTKFQRKMCSGDTLVGLNRQIDEWAKEGTDSSDIGTISIGGNDLHFSDMVMYCLLTPNALSTPTSDAEKCTNAKEDAKRLLQDQGENGLKFKLKQAYTKILTKRNSNDFHLYVTGYPEFFDISDKYCDKSHFYFWGPNHESLPSGSSKFKFLTQALRLELDTLVFQLNGVIQQAVEEVSKEYGRNAVHFVDINPKFDAEPVHRWCTRGASDPNEGRSDTWFFLSAWKDVIPGGGLQPEDPHDIERAREDLIQAGGVILPDAASCHSQLDNDADPWDRWKCFFAEVVASDPEGEVAKSLQKVNDEIKNGDIHSEDISWWLPTRWVKTFHPRSIGMFAFRDAVIESIKANQGYVPTQDPPTDPIPLASVQVCENINFQGQCTTLTFNQYQCQDLSGNLASWNDMISSIALAPETDNKDRTQCWIYNDYGCQGQRGGPIGIGNPHADLAAVTWNDIISSIKCVPDNF